MEPATDTDTCYSCLANAGVRPVSPGPRIYEGAYWNVDHAHPTKLPGWLVLVLKRHAAALHELRREELVEMGELLARVTTLLHSELGSVKEYISCFAEAEHFNHVHIHVVPRTADLPHALWGPRSFALLNPSAADAVPPSEIMALSERLRERMLSLADR